MMAESLWVRLPLTTLRGFFSNEETAQNFLYTTTTISFCCKHRVRVDFAPYQPKIRLFFTRFQGLGAPRDSCGLTYVLHPCNVYKLICITKYHFLFIVPSQSWPKVKFVFLLRKSSTKVIAAFVRPQLQRWSNPVPSCEGIEREHCETRSPKLRRFEPIKGCRWSSNDIGSS